MITSVLVLAGVVGVCVGTYGVLDGTTPRALGGPMLAAGCVVAVVGIRLAGRRVRRTRLPARPVGHRGVDGGGLRRRRRRRRCSRPAVSIPTISTRRCSRCAGRRSGVLPAIGALIGVLPAVLAPPVHLARGIERVARGGGGAMIDFDAVTVTYPESATPGSARRLAPHSRRRDVPRRRAHRSRQVDVSRRDQRPRAALHRRRAVGTRDGRRPRHPHPSSARAGRCRRRRHAGPGERLRDRHGGGGAWPTAWSNSPCLPRSCASGSRRRSICWASPTCGGGRCVRCREASSNGSRSARF